MGPSPSANQQASRAPWSRLCEDNNCVWEAKIYRDVFEWWAARIWGNKTSLLPQSHVFSENKRKPRTTKYTINVNRLCKDSSETFNFNNLLVFWTTYSTSPTTYLLFLCNFVLRKEVWFLFCWPRPPGNEKQRKFSSSIKGNRSSCLIVKYRQPPNDAFCRFQKIQPSRNRQLQYWKGEVIDKQRDTMYTGFATGIVYSFYLIWEFC